MIYAMYYVNWMWISLDGEPVVVDMAVLVVFLCWDGPSLNPQNSLNFGGRQM